MTNIVCMVRTLRLGEKKYFQRTPLEKILQFFSKNSAEHKTKLVTSHHLALFLLHQPEQSLFPKFLPCWFGTVWGGFTSKWSVHLQGHYPYNGFLSVHCRSKPFYPKPTIDFSSVFSNAHKTKRNTNRPEAKQCSSHSGYIRSHPRRLSWLRLRSQQVLRGQMSQCGAWPNVHGRRTATVTNDWCSWRAEV